MSQSTEPKLKVPGGNSTTNPSFAVPQIQTAPDVGVSQKIAGIAPTPNASVTPGASQLPPGQQHQQPPAGATPAKPPRGPGGQQIPQAPPPGQETPATPAPPTPTAPASPKVPKGGGPETTNQGVANTPGTPAPLPITTPTVPTTTTGGIPGVPNTAAIPTVTLPPTAKALEGKNAAENDWITAQNEAAQREYEAGLAFNGGPTGALAQDQLKATEGLHTATNNRGAAGTIESSLFQGDKSILSQALATNNTAAYNTYQSAMNEAQDLQQKALVIWQRAGETERKEMAEAAEKREAKEASAKQVAEAAPPTTVSAGTPIPGVPNPVAPHPAPPGMEWTPSGGGGFVPKGTKVVRTY